MIRAGLTSLRRLIYAASLLVLLICGAEVGVRTYEAATGNSVCRATDGICSDPSKLTVPSWSFHQELRPSSSATVECRDSHSEILIETNSLGLRGAEPADPKPFDVCRIVVLGDETIFAPETPDSEHFCTLLKNQLQQHTTAKIEMINAGVPGHCPLTEFVLFKRLLKGLHPDLVLMHFDWSDVADDKQIRRFARCDASGTPQTCPHSKLLSSKKPTPCHEVWRQQFRLLDWVMNNLSAEWKYQIARQKAVSREVDTNPYAWLREEHPEENLTFRHSVRPIAEMAKLCQSLHCPFVVFTSPKPWQVSPKCSRGEGVRLAAGVAREAYFSNRAPFEVLAAFANRFKIQLIDGSTVLIPGREGESNFLKYAPRWSPQGHQKMADLVANHLMEKVPGALNSRYFQKHDEPLSRTNPRESEIQWTSGQTPNSDRAVPPPQ